MNFLSPWFLLGALAVSGPVVFHLMRRSAKERTAFSSVLFLRPTPPRAKRSRKLEHVALLLLRCLGVVLLAVGFARPFFPKSGASSPPAGTGEQTVILLDTSASMRREGLWAKARALAAQHLDKASAKDRVAVVVFDQHPRTLVSFADWTSWPLDQRAAMAKARLDSVTPGWGGTQLGLALIDAAERFQDDASEANGAAARVVALISDLQEGANLDGLQGHDWPKDVRVAIERVEPSRRGNAGLEILDASLASAGDARQARARVVNSRESQVESLQMGWSAAGGDGFDGKPVQLYLPPGQTRIFQPPELPAGATTGMLRLTGSAEEFDNTSYFAVPDVDREVVAYFGTESANDPQQLRYFLQRAFPETPRRKIEVVSAASNSVFAPEILSKAVLAVIPSSLDTNETAAVRAWLGSGKTALMVLTNSESGATLSALSDAPEMQIEEATGDYALLGDIDFTQPIFAPFADPKFSDFSRIHFWKHRRWTIPSNFPARVLAKFDDGAPALAQVQVGKGSLLILSSGWDPDDSQLALSSKFLPLMQTILDWSGGAAPTRVQFQIGEPIPSPAATGDMVQWETPDGKVTALAAGAPFTETDAPGIYKATAGTTVRRFAVNLPLDESRTAAMSVDDLARLGIPMQSQAAPAAATTPAMQHLLLRAEVEGRQKVWRWLIVGLLAAALVEIVLGGWLAQRVKNLEVTP